MSKKEYIDRDQLFELIYPVGSIYLSAVATSPTDLFGIGEWEQIKDKFLLASGITYELGATGGEATHKLTVSEMPAHTHAPTTKTPGTDVYNEYAFTINRTYNSESTQRFKVDKGSGYTVMGASVNADDYGGTSDIDQTLTTASTGGSTAHNNMPPYIVINAWRRVS